MTNAQPTLSDPSLAVDLLVGQLSVPTGIAFLAPNDLLVLEKNSGRVRRVLNGVLQANAVLDVAVNADNERGLLGIAINQQAPPRVFLYYTEVSDPDGDGLPDAGAPLGNRVYRYTWNAATAKLENRQLLLDLPVLAGPNHNGGVLALGPTPTPGPTPTGQVGDGSLLYAVIGDLNRGGQLENVAGGAAPDDSAVVLRVRQDGSAAPGNPFVPYCSQTTTQACAGNGDCPGGETCRTQVARYYAYGIRNSFGLALDPVTGDLWDTENGPGSYDEINRVEPGFNSGWLPIMGPDARDPQGVGDLFTMPGTGGTYSDPEFSWLNPVAVTGIVFPSGGALGAAYDGLALVGDFNLGQLYRLPLNAARTGFDLAAFAGLGDLVADSSTERNLLRIGAGFGGISDLERGPDGAIYVVSIGSGAIYRVRAAATPTPTATASATPTATPTPFTVSGAVRYYVANRVVPGATIDVQGPASLQFVSDLAGIYGAAPLAASNWTLTPHKDGDTALAISTLDAVHILQHVAGLRTLSAAQLLACDVTGDGTCSAFDATRVLQRIAGIGGAFEGATACASDWLFVPAPSAVPNQSTVPPMLSTGMCTPGRIAYAPLTNSASGQDFVAIVFGDVTGNWAP